MYRTFYELSGFRFSLASDDPTLHQAMSTLYPALRAVSGPCASEWEIRLQICRDKPPLFALYDGELFIYASERSSATIEHLEWKILRKLLHHQDHLLQIHAAGAARNGRGLLICGPPGSGKSTLALALLLAGWRCLSDEIALLEPGTLLAGTYPRSFHLTGETLGLFPLLHLPHRAGGFTDTSGKSRFNPSTIRPDWVSSPVIPSWLVFPEYRPGSSAALIPLGETESLSILIDQTINLASHTEEGLGILLRLIRRSSCWRLLMPDIRSALDRIDALTAGDGIEMAGCPQDLPQSPAEAVYRPSPETG